MKAILMKELKGYFQSPIGYIFAGVFLALCAMFFITGSLMYQNANLKAMFANVNVIYLFLVSILTMGLFSLERSRKTDQLLLTSPVSVTQVVIGKYLAALSAFGVTLAISLVFPLVLFAFGNPATSELIGAYIGFVLLWAAFIAIGVFISALTESQMIAAVITFGVLLLVYNIDWIAANITNEFIRGIVQWFSLMSRYEEFQAGILNIENIVYYLSFIGVFLLLTVQVIRRRQYSEKKFLITNAGICSIVIVGVILLNGIVNTIGSKVSLTVDLTQEKIYEFSSQTKEVMEELTEDVNVYALYPDDAEGELVIAVKEYMKKYEDMSDKIKVNYIDPYKDPAFVRKYGEDLGIGSVVIEQGDKFKVIAFNQLYKKRQYTGEVSIDLERQMTSAIRHVSGMGTQVKVYFIEGHGEAPAPSLTNSLTNEGYEIGTLNLSNTDIPEDASLLIDMLPTVDFTEVERNALDAYLLKGGNVAFVFGAGNPKMERLNGYLEEWGITVHSDMAYEGDTSKAMRTTNGAAIPAPQMQEHPITEKLMNNGIAFAAPVSCSFGVNENNIQHTYITSLLKTSDESWGIMDLTRTTPGKVEGDIDGPLTLAVISEKGIEPNGKILAVGSYQAIETPEVLENASYSNGDFVMNAFSHMTGKGDALNIRAKIISPEKLTMTESQVRTISVVLQYILPLLVLIIGLIVWLRRRYL